ncbi:hypothetical protein BDQ94DRAFT_161455 [Aspergillus welwitschiae]|uniref:Protein kinase domain-containing protein n=1 Tax=Aspergillus welwitschiae TaxID=1341132 RepID=A0A3F3PTI1_9EURO|nr:hypothetical protein BDQ94DRAFT_161455 [Aspergillus welwitschiae]RDH30138.1 hypothetical protein BDQ94DRAFT_161455 [Aspergillus welwitschiae]
MFVGDVLNNRDKVIDKLGHGAFSTIWLSRDERKTAYVAVKVSTEDASTHDANILRMLKDCCLAHTNDRPGPNGHHQCIVTAPAKSSVSAALFYCYSHIETAHVSAAKLALAVAYVHAQGYVHGDIHLRNILIPLPTNSNKLSIEDFYEQFANDIPPDEAQLLSDFGESFSSSDHEQRRRGQNYPSPLPVWLFDATLATRHDIASQQVDVNRFVFPSLEQNFEEDIQATQQRANMSSFDKEEKIVILSMLRSMLAMNLRSGQQRQIY